MSDVPAVSSSNSRDWSASAPSSAGHAKAKSPPLHFTHLLFAIWSVTQAYADQEAQFALLLGKPALTAKDYENAEEVIVHMIWSALAP